MQNCVAERKKEKLCVIKFLKKYFHKKFQYPQKERKKARKTTRE